MFGDEMFASTLEHHVSEKLNLTSSKPDFLFKNLHHIFILSQSTCLSVCPSIVSNELYVAVCGCVSVCFVCLVHLYACVGCWTRVSDIAAF